MARLLRCLALFGLLIVVTAAPAAAADSVENQIIVGFERGAGSSEQEGIVEGRGGRLRKRLGAIRAGVVRPRSGMDLRALIRALRRHPDVAYVERDWILEASAVPDDPAFANQYGLVAQPDDADVDATEAWDRRSSCTKVAVLDTGVDIDHPDLVPNLWTNSDERPGNNRDDDDNGYVDDYRGLNLVGSDDDPLDDNGHGTHVTGIVAARGNNTTGVSGICWSSSVIPVKFMDSRGRGSMSDAAEGIEYAVRRGARIINGSFGSSSKSEALEDAIDYAKDKDTLLVVAAGNEGEDIDREPVYPAAYTFGNILSVAASTESDALADFSNFGDDAVDVAAPGDDILSTYPNDSYRTLDGTSMAAPLVAGAAALLRKHNSDAGYADLRTALRQKVDKPPAFKDKVVYDGRMNLRRALDYIEDVD